MPKGARLNSDESCERLRSGVEKNLMVAFHCVYRCEELCILREAADYFQRRWRLPALSNDVLVELLEVNAQADITVLLGLHGDRGAPFCRFSYRFNDALRLEVIDLDLELSFRGSATRRT